MEEIPRSGDDRNLNLDMERRKTSDAEMLHTYSTGLLAVCLAWYVKRPFFYASSFAVSIFLVVTSSFYIHDFSGGQLVEDVLTSGLAAKLIRYLRIRVLGDINTNLKDGNISIDNKSVPNMVVPKIKDEGRGRSRQVTGSSHLDADSLKSHPSEKDRHRDPALLDEPAGDREVCVVSRQSCGDECWGDEEPRDSKALDIDAHDAEADIEGKCHVKDFLESKTKHCGKSHREEDLDESVRDDSSRRKANRGSSRSRGKGRSSEGVSENEQSLTSPGSGSKSGQARIVKDRSVTRNQELRRVSDAKRGSCRSNDDYVISERDDNDDCFKDCKFGPKDITDLVKKAVRAAEAEARAANAPAMAIKAAGDDAAEVVKIAALEVSLLLFLVECSVNMDISYIGFPIQEYRKTNDEEAAVTAASRAASTVLDAANAVTLSRFVLYPFKMSCY